MDKLGQLLKTVIILELPGSLPFQNILEEIVKQPLKYLSSF